MKISIKHDISIKKLVDGDISAYEQLYCTYFNDLYRFAYHYIMSHEAEDIVQDVFIKIYENRSTLPKDLSVKSYLYSATKNSCLNYLRHMNVIDKNHDKLVEAIVHCSEYNLEEDTEIEMRVEQCLSKLSPQQRSILKLRAEGNDYNQIATILNISPGTVNTHIIRAYRYFRDNFVFIVTVFIADK